MDNSKRIAEMRSKLESLAPTFINIIDDSHKHVGHAGAREGKGHFTLEISSEKLIGLSRIKQHQTIYAALGDLMNTDIHALTIRIV